MAGSNQVIRTRKPGFLAGAEGFDSTFGMHVILGMS
jgi:hypothetical protein